MFNWAGIKAKLVAAGVVVFAVLAAIGLALRRSRQDGINQVLTEQQERRDELQQHYDEIDGRPPDLDAAIDRLRKRSSGDR